MYVHRVGAVEEQLQSALQDHGTKGSELRTSRDEFRRRVSHRRHTTGPSKTQCQLSDCPQKGPAGDADREPSWQTRTTCVGHLGTLSWVQRVCRPDLAHACGCLAQVGHNPPRKGTLGAITALREVPPPWHTRHGTGIRTAIRRQHHGDGARRLWTDSDFAPNYGDGYGNYRSTSGHLFPYNNTPVQWASRRQDLLAMAAHEAEIYAAVDAAKEAAHLHRDYYRT
jgi:hypothetical protein